MATAITALILDFGEVLVRPQSAASIQGMAQLAKLETEEFRQRYWRHRPDYDAGHIAAAAYWRQVMGAAALGQTPDEPEAATIDALIEADAASWVDYREELWELAKKFRTRHGRTAFLSNGVPEVMSRVRTEKKLSDYFDAVVISYEVGCTKPEARIYDACLSALGVPAESALFVDDKRENLDAAEKLGMQVLHFTGESSIADLRTRLTHVA